MEEGGGDRTKTEKDEGTKRTMDVWRGKDEGGSKIDEIFIKKGDFFFFEERLK
jgi:hypothetical protein